MVYSAVVTYVITLKDTDQNGIDLTFSATINNAKTIITIDPTNNFTSGQKIYAAIGASVEDYSDNLVPASSKTFIAEYLAADLDEPFVEKDLVSLVEAQSEISELFIKESINPVLDRLEWIRRNKNSKKFFYGINSGNYGFLMNKFSLKKIIKNLSKAKMIIISPLEMLVKNNKNQNKKYLAINEVSILRQSRQAASLSINYGSKTIIKKLVSDGVLVSTPAGSTAYNLSVHGPILSLNSKKLSISPISPFRPRRWKGKIVHDKSKIIIKNLNPKKRPISAVADNIEVRNAKNIIVKKNKKVKFNLLYDQNRSLQKKIKIEQLRRETS